MKRTLKIFKNSGSLKFIFMLDSSDIIAIRWFTDEGRCIELSSWTFDGFISCRDSSVNYSIEDKINGHKCFISEKEVEKSELKSIIENKCPGTI